MKTYIITGMGRSATSFLAESLKKNGVDIGDKFYMGENAGGGYENQDFVDLNKKVFTEAGMKWGIEIMPTEEEKLKKAFEKYKDEYRKLIEKHKGESWGVKEPRFSLLLPYLMELVEEVDDDPFIYIAFRNPDKVGKSLNKLNKDIEKGEETAREYNRRIIKFLEKKYA